jgi:phage shock protein A
MGLMDKLRKGVVEVAEEAEKAARIGRLKTEVSGFNEQKERIFREIGQLEAKIEETRSEGKEPPPPE